MSESATHPSPEPSSADVPGWVYDLVPIAAHARMLMRTNAFALLTATVIVVLVPQLVARPAPGVVAACMAFGSLLALRHGGWSVPAAEASVADGGTAGARVVPAAPAGSAAAAAGTAAGAAAAAPGSVGARLRPGGRTGALLAVLDLLLTAVGLAALVGLALAGADRPLLVSAAGAAAGLTLGVGSVAVMELSGRHKGAVAVLGVVGIAVTVVAACFVMRLELSWWWVLALAIGADAAGLLALRAGTRNDRRADTA
ncbi:hypothetical protein [Actinomyces sp.]|uniref:hypothetical protein n=1 Tax=Actinomyces sp. TaxID=29317 RepID=UPI0026DDC8CB|nr:hypothetical protein [Actinomyces sp.]MDO4901267.1 hypothetical protein [Actinomyces sp.]